MSDHRHATDRWHGQVIMACPEDPDHFGIELSATNSERKPSELLNRFDACPVCGAGLSHLESERPTEVLE